MHHLPDIRLMPTNAALCVLVPGCHWGELASAAAYLQTYLSDNKQLFQTEMNALDDF